jgi:hypothetical protein
VKYSRLAILSAFCGTGVVAGVVAGSLAGLDPPGIKNANAPVEASRATFTAADVEHVDARHSTSLSDGVSVAGIERGGAAWSEPREDWRPATPPTPIASIGTPEPAKDDANEAACSVETADMGSGSAALPDCHPMRGPAKPTTLFAVLTPTDPAENAVKPSIESESLDTCLNSDLCVDQYLWALYERTPKVDTVTAREQIKVKVKNKGKTRTVVKTLVKYVTENFAWKDTTAAEKTGMSLQDYVIGGMDPGFKRQLYGALRAMDDAGLVPGITSAFRDNYRQELASGNKAAPDSSYHGGSRRGGYGHGLAADLVSVKGETRAERYKSSEILWKWIDAHEKELGVGRPYLDRDPPHIAPLDGKEFADKRGLARLAGLKKPSPLSNVK